jgi:hypothetical protein
MTLREICSDILNDVRSFNLDNRISYRYIIHKLFDKTAIFIRQDAENRKLQKLPNLWTTISCFELEDAPLNECESSCDTVLKSVNTLPDTYESNFGYLIKVYNNDYSKEFLPATPGLYKDLKNRPFPTKNGYYWIVDKHLYIPDSNIESVTIQVMAKENAKIITAQSSPCSKPLDSTFNFPDYIVSLAKTEVLKEISGVTKRIQPDEKPNDNEKDK